MKNKIFSILVLCMCIAVATVFLIKSEKVVSQTTYFCGSNFRFDNYIQVSSNNLQTKNITDKFLKALVKMNNYQRFQDFCASAIKGKKGCIQYFDVQAASGGSVLICINPKTKSLVSAEFEQ